MADVSCGPGHVLQMLKDPTRLVVGVVVAVEMIVIVGAIVIAKVIILGIVITNSNSNSSTSKSKSNSKIRRVHSTIWYIAYIPLSPKR